MNINVFLVFLRIFYLRGWVVLARATERVCVGLREALSSAIYQPRLALVFLLSRLFLYYIYLLLLL